MKRLHLIIMLVVIAVVISWITTIILIRPVVATNQIYTDVIVRTDGVAAFGITKEGMRFGDLGPGDVAKRDFLIVADETVKVKIEGTGNISKFLIASENDFILKAGENRTIVMHANIPAGTPPGNYSGYIHVTYFKPLFR